MKKEVRLKRPGRKFANSFNGWYRFKKQFNKGKLNEPEVLGKEKSLSQI